MGEQVLGVILEHLQCANASSALRKVTNFKWKQSARYGLALDRNLLSLAVNLGELCSGELYRGAKTRLYVQQV